MTQNNQALIPGSVMEEELSLTLEDLCRACVVEQSYVIVWVQEGVLEPVGHTPADWRFSGAALRKVRMARWLAHDLEINPSGVALALDLLDEIHTLQARLERAGLN